MGRIIIVLILVLKCFVSVLFRAFHAKNKFAGRIITTLVLDLWDENIGIYMRWRHAISPVFSHHYQDLDI